jgi:hypothetical protein
MAEQRQECNQFLAVKRPFLAVERQIVADGIQRFCGFEAFSLSYRKRKLKEDLSTPRLARPQRWRRRGVGKSLSRPSKNALMDGRKKTGAQADLPKAGDGNRQL